MEIKKKAPHSLQAGGADDARNCIHEIVPRGMTPREWEARQLCLAVPMVALFAVMTVLELVA